MSNFKILTDRDHILQRAGMYIGSTTTEKISQLINFEYRESLEVVPGLLKIINEIIDNSIDEAIRTDFKYANKIDITIENNMVTVSDNGRGIPVVQYDGIYQAEASWTRAKAGTSFSDDRKTIGTNGVGSFATNCFSTSFIGESSDGKQKVTVICEDNCNPDKINTTVTKSKSKGTTVQFKPDLSRFGLTDITTDHLEILKDRLFNIQICYPTIQFTFNGQKIKSGSLSDVSKRFPSDAIVVANETNLKIILGASGDDQEFRFVSYLNGLNLVNGGNHIDYIVTNICNELRPLIKRKWKIEVMPNQIKQHLLLGIWCSGFTNPKFDSQSKERLTNTQSEISAFFTNIDYPKIAKKIIGTESIIMPMVEAILYKKEQAEKKAARQALKSTAKIKSDKHIAATSKNPLEKSLVIAEGLSAVSSALAARNPLIHGAYALRGKVLNTHEMKNEEIALNKELAELISILGLDLYSPGINEVPEKLYQIDIDGETFIAANNDIIITKNGQKVQVAI